VHALEKIIINGAIYEWCKYLRVRIRII